ncbi:hypothetical protein ANO14919_066930 [Xylariales sp. No.14919]|nr:hypothetical protein F5X98DRAFT_38291 [Xylaria grammica]GAW17239.1 hypothetical protein ANO14919_066930 [Xylariales sp. No.14919]
MTVLPPDPYRVLGVAKDAQIPEIRSAHRRLVLKCHPDKIQDPALKEAKQIEFQQVQQAYELLSNEIERERYDRKAEVYEREREREWEKARTSAARATSSTPKREPAIFYNVKEASPRASTFKSSPYGRTPPRSWEDTTTAARMFEEATRHARKTASYEKEKPSKRDEERRRREENKEWERERAKAKEREAREARKAKERKEEKERSARDREEREKEKRKDEKKKAQSDREREREKERKTAAAEKHRSRQPPIIDEIDSGAEASNSDVEYQPIPSKSERKKSSSGQKPEDIDPPPPPPSSERTRKLSGNMETAIRYLARSSGKPPSFLRAQTFTEGSSSKLYATPMVPVPTPPPATTPFAPPPPPVEEPEEMSDDDIARRSSARPSRRMSHDTPRSSREKSSLHKKSSSSRDHQPIIVEAGSPPVRAVPSLPRSHTESYARPIPVPGMSRAETWYPGTERERERHGHERHERSRSRPTPGYTDSEESGDDRDRRHRRNRRTQSPEPMTAHVRYAVDSNGTKSIPIRQKQYHEQPPRGAYKVKGGFAVPNSSARVHRGHKAYYYEEERGQHFPPSGVKYSTQFGADDIRYSDLPYGGSSSYHQTNIYA